MPAGDDGERGIAPAFRIAALGLASGQIGGASLLLRDGAWLIDGEGRPVAADFLAFYTAGRESLAGQAAALYEPAFAKAAQVAALGRDFAGTYGWHYPPTYLLVTAPLSSLCLLVAQIVWVAVTLALLLIVLWRIAGLRGVAVGLAVPALLGNLVTGQNGFLTAALVGASLLLVERRPGLAGTAVGLLAIKPHLGLLFPVALAAGRHGCAILAATATVAGTALLTAAIFGVEPWLAFFGSMAAGQAQVLGAGIMGFGKLQSAYGLVRAFGGGAGAAWTAQAIVTGTVGIAVAWLWRSSSSTGLKAAGLAAASLLATPYVYLYDAVLLSVPAAFLVRDGVSTREGAALLLAAGTLLAFPFIGYPVGMAAPFLVGAVVAVRAVRTGCAVERNSLSFAAAGLPGGRVSR